MSGTPKDPQNFVHTAQFDGSEAMHIRHPLNKKSDLYMTRLSDPTGLTHVGVSLARLPPGKESFALHVHTIHEEWIFVVSGEGQVQLDADVHPIRAGDFVGFPANGSAHLVRNNSTADLVYLQGGDRRAGDRGHFPELGLIGYQHDEGHMALIPEEQVKLRPFSDWMAQD